MKQRSAALVHDDEAIANSSVDAALSHQQLRQPENAVDRRADFVGNGRDKARFFLFSFVFLRERKKK